MAQSELEILVKLKDEASSSLESMKGSLAGLGVSMMAVGGSIAAGLGMAVKAAADAEVVNKRFETVLKNVSKATNEQIDALREQQKALMQTTRFDDDAIASAQAFLGTFNLTSDSIKSLTPHLLDMAAGVRTATGETMNLEQASNMLGKSIANGSLSMLQRVGVTIPGVTKEAQKLFEKQFELATQQERVAMLAKVMDGNFKGLAVAEGQTLAGQTDILKHSFDDLVKLVGVQLIPMLTQLTGTVQPVLASVTRWAEKNPELTKTIVLTTAAVSGLMVVLPLLVGAITTIGAPVAATVVGFGVLVTAIVAVTQHFDLNRSSIMALIVQIDKKTGLVTQLKNAWTQVWNAIKTQLIPAFNQLMEASKPYIPLYEALGKLLLEVIIVALKLFIECMKDLLLLFVSVIAKVTEFQAAIAKFFQPAIGLMKSLINDVSGAVDMLIQKFDQMIQMAQKAFNEAQKVAGTVSRVGTAVATAGMSEVIRAIPHAAGGIVTSPHVGLVGEAGPEAIIPLDRFGGFGNNVNVTITGNNISNQMDLRDIADKVGKSIMDRLAMNGRLAL